MPPSNSLRPLAYFFGVLLVLVLFNVTLGFLSIPFSILVPATIVSTIFVVAAPMFGLYKAAAAPWTPKLGVILLVGGLLVHQGLGFMLKPPTPDASLGFRLTESFLAALSQAGLLTWCLALGSLIATLIKEKNLLLPIAIFLAAFDVFLVLTPIGFTQKLLKAHPEVFNHVAYHVPSVSQRPTGGIVAPFVQIGPADLLFLGMFFISLYRFQMRTRQTMLAVIPTLLVYLGIVMFFGNVHLGRISLGALPALLPIGTVVILVNWKEFKMNTEEKLSTLVIAAIALGIVTYGMTRKPVIEEPSNPDQAAPVAPSKAPSQPKPAPVKKPSPKDLD